MEDAKFLKHSIELVYAFLCTARLHYSANKVAQQAPNKAPPLYLIRPEPDHLTGLGYVSLSK